MKVKSLSRVRLFATPGAAAYQAPRPGFNPCVEELRSHKPYGMAEKKKRKEINMTKIILSEQQNASYHEDQLLSNFRRRNKFLLRLLKTACLNIIEVLLSLPGREGLEISLTSLLPGLVCFLL